MPKYGIKLIIGILTTLGVVFFFLSPVEAKSGCCSWHQGVCGCDTSVGRQVCCDGTYSPSCTCAYIAPTKKLLPTSTPRPLPTSTPRPTSTPKPTNTPIPPSPTASPTLVSSSPTTTTPLNSTNTESLQEDKTKVSQGIITEENEQKEEGVLSSLLKSLFNIITFNLFNNEELVSPIPNESPTPSIILENNKLATSDSSVLGESNYPTINPSELFDVVSVTDGDTIKVRMEGKVEDIRLIGIDTPETVDPRKPVQCFGQEASDKAKELLNGQKVKLESDSTQSNRDKYDRLLRYAWRSDGLFYNDWIIRNGYAHEYTYDLPYKYQQQFKEAETYARENNLGLWNPLACISPTSTPQSTSFTNTDTKTQIYTENSTQEKKDVSGYSCDCSKVCGEMSSCDEAYYQLNQCGCTRRDGDKDGIPCESICK